MLTPERVAEIRRNMVDGWLMSDAEVAALLDVWEAARAYVETRSGPEWFRNGDLDKYDALARALGGKG